MDRQQGKCERSLEKLYEIQHTSNVMTGYTLNSYAALWEVCHAAGEGQGEEAQVGLTCDESEKRINADSILQRNVAGK